MLFVVVEMTPLAPMAQVVQVAILWCVIEVGSRQDHLGAGFWMREAIASATVWEVWRTFAHILGSLTHLAND